MIQICLFFAVLTGVNNSNTLIKKFKTMNPKATAAWGFHLLITSCAEPSKSGKELSERQRKQWVIDYLIHSEELIALQRF